MSPTVVLSRDEAARVWQATAGRSVEVRFVVGLLLVTGWTVAEAAHALRSLQAGSRS